MKKLLVTLFSYDGRIRRRKYAVNSIPALWLSIILSTMMTLQWDYYFDHDAMLFVTFFSILPILGWMLPAIMLLILTINDFHSILYSYSHHYWPLYLQLYLTFFFLLGLVMLVQGAKRCHDLGRSGWWQLIPFYWFWILFKDGQHGSNRYGEDPKSETQ